MHAIEWERMKTENIIAMISVTSVSLTHNAAVHYSSYET